MACKLGLACMQLTEIFCQGDRLAAKKNAWYVWCMQCNVWLFDYDEYAMWIMGNDIRFFGEG